MPETYFEQVGTAVTKDWESCGTLQNHLFGTFHITLLGIRVVSKKTEKNRLV